MRENGPACRPQQQRRWLQYGTAAQFASPLNLAQCCTGQHNQLSRLPRLVPLLRPLPDAIDLACYHSPPTQRAHAPRSVQGSAPRTPCLAPCRSDARLFQHGIRCMLVRASPRTSLCLSCGRVLAVWLAQVWARAVCCSASRMTPSPPASSQPSGQTPHRALSAVTCSLTAHLTSAPLTYIPSHFASSSILTLLLICLLCLLGVRGVVC